MKLTLRQNYARLQSMRHYNATANTLSAERAQEIAASFGECLADVASEFAYANECGQTRMDRADTNGNGLGLFHSAERMFFSHVYQLHFEGECDSLAATSHGDSYSADY